MKGTLKYPDEGYGPNNTGAPGISKKENFIMKLCLSKSIAPKIFSYGRT